MLPSGAHAVGEQVAEQVAEQQQDAPPPAAVAAVAAAAGKSAGGPAPPKREKKGGLSRDVLVSKALSKLLRHDAEKAGLQLDEEGFADVGEVLKYNRLKSLKATLADLHHVVSIDTKQRYALKPNPATPSAFLIRANQGHSISLASSAHLTPITLAADNVPPFAVHGTYCASYPAILAAGGLRPMTRNHVHFATALPEDAPPGAVVSGMRADAEILIFIDVRRSLEDGAAEWWRSENGVVLCAGDAQGLVNTRYWTRVEGRGRAQDVGVLWEGGREVKEMSESARGRRAPRGKGPRGEKRGGGRGGEGRGKGVKKVGGLEELGALGGGEVVDQGVDTQE